MVCVVKKVYFISPEIFNLSMWYKEVDDNFNDIRLRVGYNDSSEMRSVDIDSKYFSEDPNKLLAELKRRKQVMIAQAYRKLAKEINKKVAEKPEDAFEFDNGQCPF